jgi:uncharacterized protein (TIGR02186 family)
MVHLLRGLNLLVSAALGLLFLAADTLAAAAQAEAQDVIEAGASENYFYIEPSFDGTNVVLFGAIDRDKVKGDSFDLAISLSGPLQSMTVWQKERRANIWINTRSLTFESVPSYYAILSTKPIEKLAPIEERRKYGLGFDALSDFSPIPADAATAQAELDQFRQALIRIKQTNGLFVENGNPRILFFGKSLFRTTIFLPARAGAGVYRAKIFVLQDGKVIGAASSHIHLQKTGIEALLSSASEQHPWVYGAFAVFLAVVVGSGASFVFRRA